MGAIIWQLRVYRASLRLLPHDFRGRYADQMELLFSERLADESTAKWSTTFVECCNVVMTAVRVRFGGQPLQAPALIALTVVLAFVRPSHQALPRIGLAPVDSVDFVARDPAGEFTLHLRYGRAVGGTIDHYRLTRRHLIQTQDSIRVLSPHGRVLFAVSYNRDAARIQWAARPAACRGRALECGATQ
jgi:hypothetical protein